jgi:hypothetical protein
MRTKLVLVAATVGLVVTAGIPGAGADDPGPRARLSGANEVGGGDPDGRGKIDIYEEHGQACFTLTWRNIGAPTAAHIHKGVRGKNGPVVHTFYSGRPITDSRRLERCTSDYDADLAAAVLANPSDYYVNVHNREYPDGAIRGQLEGG